MASAAASVPAVPTHVVDDVGERRLVVAIMLIAIALDAAAAPAFAAAHARANAEFSIAPAIAACAAVVADAGYLAAIVASLWTVAFVGKRAYLASSLLVFGATTLTCAVAPNASVYLFADIVGSVALGGFFSAGLLTIVGASPKADLPLAMTLFALVSLAAPTVAPLYAATLLGDASWREILGWFAVPALASALVAATVMRDPTPRAPGRFDFVGFVALVASLAGFQIFANARALAGDAAPFVGPLALTLATAALGFFARREVVGRATRFVDVCVARNAPIARGLVACVLVGALVQGSGFESAFARIAHQANDLQSARWIAVRLVGIVLGVVAVTALDARAVPSRILVAAGALGLAMTCGGLAFAIADGAGPTVHVAIGIAQGCALALVVGPLAALLFGAVDRDGFASLAIFFKLAIVLGGTAALALVTLGLDLARAAHVPLERAYVCIWAVETIVALAVAGIATGLAARPAVAAA